ISLHPVYLIISLILTSIAFLLNLFAFMNIFPLWLSLPFLFLSIFVSLHFFIRFITFITKIKTTSVNWWFALRLKAFVTGLGLKGPLNGLPFCTTLTR